MRTKLPVLVAVLLVLGLLVPSAGLARRHTVVGSLSIAKSGGGTLTTELVGVAIFATPSWEKTVTQQIPPFTLPVVLDAEEEGEDTDAVSPSHRRRGPIHTDTVLILTNTTDVALGLQLTVRSGPGAVIFEALTSLDANETRVLVLSDLLP